jgi:hypothetical protein
VSGLHAFLGKREQQIDLAITFVLIRTLLD